jgi:hypothetical protein
MTTTRSISPVHTIVRSLSIAVTILLLAPTARAAEAEKESPYARSGPYIGIGLVWAPSVFDMSGAEDAIPPRRDRWVRPSPIAISSGSMGASAGGSFHVWRPNPTSSTCPASISAVRAEASGTWRT